MCMTIKKVGCKSKKQFLVGYKVVDFCNKSAVEYFQYIIGENYSNRGHELLSNSERQSMSIDRGFHIFTTYKAAELYICSSIEKIIKVYYRPQYVVAYGHTNVIKFGKDRELPTVVTTQLTIKSFDPVG